MMYYLLFLKHFKKHPHLGLSLGPALGDLKNRLQLGVSPTVGLKERLFEAKNHPRAVG